MAGRTRLHLEHLMEKAGLASGLNPFAVPSKLSVIEQIAVARKRGESRSGTHHDWIFMDWGLESPKRAVILEVKR